MYSTEQLKIDTPEQIALEFPLAGIGSRFLAIAIDTVLQVLIGLLLVLAFTLAGAVFGAHLPSFLGGFGPALVILAVFCVYWGYFAGFEIFSKGQTPGKRVAGIRVIKESGRPLDATAAILRNLVRVIDLIPGMYGIGVACMLLNRQSRRLGDLVAGTVVVHDRPLANIGSHWAVKPATAAARSVSPTASLLGIRVTDDELVLIEAYLERRYGLDWQVHEKMVSLIVSRITERTGARPEPGQAPGDFLEAVARQARDAARFR